MTILRRSLFRFVFNLFLGTADMSWLFTLSRFGHHRFSNCGTACIRYLTQDGIQGSKSASIQMGKSITYGDPVVDYGALFRG
ncbi:hypothetical protein F5146DRAFT_1022776 [Armillaria mellea]|nr:hypothetical protein F5146DRAFT_1022776 [Armillaria mellea]